MSSEAKAAAAGGDTGKEGPISLPAPPDEDFNSNMVELTFAQEEGIKKEVIKRLKKERVLEGGVRLLREKSAFQW